LYDGACARASAIIQTVIQQSREWRLRAHAPHDIITMGMQPYFAHIQ
jgi:hypothetical protein